MSSAKGKSRGWSGFLDRGKRKDTDPASSTRPPTLSFDDPTFDDAHRFATTGDRTMLDGVAALSRDADATIPPDDVPAGALSQKVDEAIRIGIGPERTELVDAAALGLEFERESTDRHARPSERELEQHDTDRPARDTDPPKEAKPEKSELKESTSDELKAAPRSDTNEDPPSEISEDDKKAGRFRGMSFRPIRERNRTASKAREINIPPAEITKSDAPPRGEIDAQLFRLDAPAGIKPPEAVRIGDDDAELTMLHPAVAIGIAPAPGASPKVPPVEGKLRVPDSGGPALELPPPDAKAPTFKLDKPDSPLSRLEPEEPKDYNPLTDNDPALEAAVWATDNLARLKTTFKIIPISMIAGLMLAGIFVSTQGAIRGNEKNTPMHTTGTRVTPLPEQPAEPTKAAIAPPPRTLKAGVAISSAPSYAMVSVNGAEIGRTPLVLPPPERDIGLKVRVSADDHEPWEAEITLKEDFGEIIAVSAQSYAATATSAHKDQRTGRHHLEIRLTKHGP